MTPRPSADVLTEIRDILLRIERILTREADNATVDYYVRRLSQPRPVTLPGMPDPPIAPVPTWGSAQTSGGTSVIGNATDGRSVDNRPRTFMHGGWIHASGFSMAGP